MPAIVAIVLAGHPSAVLAAPAKVDLKLRAAKAPVGELDKTRTLGLPGGGALYRFQQRVSGVRVLDGEAVVSDAPGTAPKLVADATKARVPAPPAPRVTRQEAIAIASGSVGVERLRGRVSAALAIEPRDRALVWRVEIPAARPLGDFEVLVDAISGAVRQTSNLLRDRTGTRQALQAQPGGRARRLPRARRGPQGPRHQPADHAAPRRLAAQDRTAARTACAVSG